MTATAKPRVNLKYQVLRDTSEKDGHGWWFQPSDVCLGTVERNLYTADYSIVIHDGERQLVDCYKERLFVVERKGAIAEFVSNLFQKEKWDDFKQVLERMEEFRHPFIICEFPFNLVRTYPAGSTIPRHLWPKIRTTPQAILRRILEIELRFKTKIHFTDGPGQDVASSLFKRVMEYAQVPLAS